MNNYLSLLLILIFIKREEHRTKTLQKSMYRLLKHFHSLALMGLNFSIPISAFAMGSLGNQGIMQLVVLSYSVHPSLFLNSFSKIGTPDTYLKSNMIISGLYKVIHPLWTEQAIINRPNVKIASPK